MPTNRDIADQLDLVYQLMQLAGENRFKAIAFDRASQTIRGFEEDLGKYIEEKRLMEIKGIGKSIANDIYAYVETGQMPVLEAFKEKSAGRFNSMVEYIWTRTKKYSKNPSKI